RVRRTALTAADGSYSFADLRPGTYAVTVTPLSAYAEGSAVAGTAGGAAGPNAVSGITLLAGARGDRYDFGEIGATLSGTVFLDADGDGVRGPGEAGVAGALVTLTPADVPGRAVVLATTTAADGSYRFAGLAAGAYTLAADFGGDPAPVGAAHRPLFVVVRAGAAESGLDFGEPVP